MSRQFSGDAADPHIRFDVEPEDRPNEFDLLRVVRRDEDRGECLC